MTTNEASALELINNNGGGSAAPDDPPATRIVWYRTAFGGIAYGVTFPHNDPDTYLRETTYVRNPVIVWEIGR